MDWKQVVWCSTYGTAYALAIQRVIDNAPFLVVRGTEKDAHERAVADANRAVELLEESISSGKKSAG